MADEVHAQADRDAASGSVAGRSMLGAALALTLLAAAFASWSGYAWQSAAGDDRAAFAKTREEVLAVGEQAVINLHTLDFRDLRKGRAVWEESATGDVLSDLRQNWDAFSKQVVERKSVTSAKTLSGAVTELNTHEGKAEIMVALRVSVSLAGAKPSTRESRMLATLTKTAEGWKASRLYAAPLAENPVDPAPAETGK
ncbi:hypothetical protein ACFQLX_13125 [Streptomyces polyrhachis]|uniref:Mce-associated membrane protein n=1 Tax=Streptomyces polyrhachis TaxID=1282885 RepID=A0ABW2GGR5_9ACTN